MVGDVRRCWVMVFADTPSEDGVHLLKNTGLLHQASWRRDERGASTSQVCRVRLSLLSVYPRCFDAFKGLITQQHLYAGLRDSRLYLGC